MGDPPSEGITSLCIVLITHEAPKTTGEIQDTKNLGLKFP